MKGWAVFFMLVLVSAISIIIALTVFISNVGTSIVEKEKLSIDSLERLLHAFDEQDTRSSILFNEAITTPRISLSIIASFENNINEISHIDNSIEIVERPITFQKYQYLRSEIARDIDQVMRIADYYTIIRTNENFYNAEIELRKSLEHTDDLIREYNANVMEYNKLIIGQPVGIIASIMQKNQLLPFEVGDNIEEPTGLDFN